jgi:hypothetical protein
LEAVNLDVHIDRNDGNGECIYQLTDDRFYLVVWVAKVGLDEVKKAVAALAPGEEAEFGQISCGGRVWICRNESDYELVVGDSDSKDVCYRIPQADLDRILAARPEI